MRLSRRCCTQQCPHWPLTVHHHSHRNRGNLSGATGGHSGTKKLNMRNVTENMCNIIWNYTGYYDAIQKFVSSASCKIRIKFHRRIKQICKTVTSLKTKFSRWCEWQPLPYGAATHKNKTAIFTAVRTSVFTTCHFIAVSWGSRILFPKVWPVDKVPAPFCCSNDTLQHLTNNKA